MRFFLVSVFALGCGSVSDVPKDAAGDTTSNQQDAMVDAPSCGAAGQACCANNMCSTNLSCTASDQVCRASVLFVGASNQTTGQAYVLRGVGSTFAVDPIGQGSVFSVWGTAANDVWVIAGYNDSNNAQKSYARHWNGTIWETALPFTPDGFVYGLWGSAANNYWAFTNGGGSYHWTGSSWGTLTPIDSGQVFNGAWGSSATNIYAFDGKQWHYDGTWTSTSPTDFRATRPNGARASGELWTGGSDPAGYNPAVLHIAGATRTVEPLSADNNCHEVVAIWPSGTDVWAIDNGLIAAGQCTVGPRLYHRTSSWAEVTTGLPAWQNVNAMWGTSDKDIYVSGKNAAGEVALFHYDGAAWTPVYSTTTATFAGANAMWGPGGTN
jgi:hypothetical protein